jgi:hypothetical protein
MAKNDGGPAFPIPPMRYDQIETHFHGAGMSLRQWYRGMALLGMLAHSTRYRPRPGAPENWHDAIAQEADQIADAMLAQDEND